MTDFRWYQASFASFFVPHSMLSVLFPFLIAVHLGESPERLGQAQMALLLPGLGILLIAGVIADRVDQRRMLIALHLLNVLPVAGLVVALRLGQVSYTTVLVFALASGTGTAFVQPVLDAMLNRIAAANLQRSVTATVAFSYAVNLVGFLLAGRADQIGLVPLFGLYIAFMGGGAVSSARLPSAPPVPGRERRSILGEIREGLRIVGSSKRMLPTVVLAAFGGLTLGGPYNVLVPLFLRDIYEGGAGGIAGAFGAFVIGGATSTTIFLRIGGVRWLGRGLVTGYVFSGLALLVWSLHVPYWGFLLTIGFWGFGGGMCISTGRTIMQEAAPAAHRAGVLSVQYLAGLGTAPIGSLVMGYIVGAWGPLRGALVAAIATITCCVLILIKTGIWHDRSTTGPDPATDRHAQ